MNDDPIEPTERQLIEFMKSNDELIETFRMLYARIKANDALISCLLMDKYTEAELIAMNHKFRAVFGLDHGEQPSQPSADQEDLYKEIERSITFAIQQKILRRTS